MDPRPPAPAPRPPVRLTLEADGSVTVMPPEKVGVTFPGDAPLLPEDDRGRFVLRARLAAAALGARTWAEAAALPRGAIEQAVVAMEAHVRPVGPR